MDKTTRYHHALLDLVPVTRAFIEAFHLAARCSTKIEGEGGPVVDAVLSKCSAELREAAEQVPGLRELLIKALLSPAELEAIKGAVLVPGFPGSVI